MSDSEDSVVSQNGSEKSATHDDTIETMPTRQNGDKPEEFEKLLQSMIAIIHSASEEEEQVEEEDNVNEKKIVGRPVSIDSTNEVVLYHFINKKTFEVDILRRTNQFSQQPNVRKISTDKTFRFQSLARFGADSRRRS
ncbi:Uncharacterized protein DBV15_04443 [Temnothorax longispinosus]|uniref:Uncharacterized protein n=1 Tax=Temnothorax longispinosus TaxID=300112 RepID=A0A4V3S9N0_9HYME|nr:Uncharacterized protein DBV15_04443 [Temnothorax longispinosus]